MDVSLTEAEQLKIEMLQLSSSRVIYASHGIFFPPVRFFLLNCIFARTDFFKEISR